MVTDGMQNMEGMGMEGGAAGVMADMQAHMIDDDAMSGDSMRSRSRRTVR